MTFDVDVSAVVLLRDLLHDLHSLGGFAAVEICENLNLLVRIHLFDLGKHLFVVREPSVRQEVDEKSLFLGSLENLKCPLQRRDGIGLLARNDFRKVLGDFLLVEPGGRYQSLVTVLLRLALGVEDDMEKLEGMLRND